VFVEGVNSQLNDYYAYTTSELQQDACHETGHALGMGHNYYKTSCMYGSIAPDASRYPAAGDYTILTQVYP
jgi:predicted Zn-dependent protease